MRGRIGRWAGRFAGVVLAVVGPLPASVACAAEIQRCVGDGRIAFSDRGCPAGMQVQGTVDIVADPPTQPAPQPRTDAKRSAAGTTAAGTVPRARIASRPRSANAAAASESRGARCNRARAERDAERQRLGMTVDYLTTRRLDDRVYDACK